MQEFGKDLGEMIVAGIRRPLASGWMKVDRVRELPNKKIHPDAVEHVERGTWEGKPIIGVDSGYVDGELYTVLRIRKGTSTGTVMFDGHGDDPEEIDPDEDGLS